DVAGLAASGTPNDKIQQRIEQIGIKDHLFEANPVVLWDIYGTSGHPVRTTISEMGPTLLSRILQLNDTQSGIMDILFKLVDDQGLLLLDIDDLRTLLNYIAAHRKEISSVYGLISPQSIGAIQLSLLSLEQEGGRNFFGEPALDFADLMRTDLTGKGIINILAADKLILKPRLYSTFLLWLLSELFETLPEIGDMEKPRLVFFFDEAHLLFDDAPPAMVQRVEQVIRIIRSKGVGIYFCSQFPDDVPNDILGQLGNRIQHALRAYTPRDQKAVRTAAETFVSNPKLDVASVISRLGIGEALVSTLQDKGVPMPVEKTLISPPRCRMGSLTAQERAAVVLRSPVGLKYDMPLNRESAHEILTRRAQETVSNAPDPDSVTNQKLSEKDSAFKDFLWGTKRRQGMVETMAKQTVRTVGSQIGRQIFRGLMGGLFGGKR
ncbi:MAG: helicase HerA-like domain-containing protein, partial [Desulfotignum sp.]